MDRKLFVSLRSWRVRFLLARSKAGCDFRRNLSARDDSLSGTVLQEFDKRVVGMHGSCRRVGVLNVSVGGVFESICASAAPIKKTFSRGTAQVRCAGCRPRSLLVWTHPPLYGLAVQRAKMRVS